MGGDQRRSAEMYGEMWCEIRAAASACLLDVGGGLRGSFQEDEAVLVGKGLALFHRHLFRRNIRGATRGAVIGSGCPNLSRNTKIVQVKSC
eukprot:6212715-Pleurochrysis_carterae.AAC.1